MNKNDYPELNTTSGSSVIPHDSDLMVVDELGRSFLLEHFGPYITVTTKVPLADATPLHQGLPFIKNYKPYELAELGFSKKLLRKVSDHFGMDLR